MSRTMTTEQALGTIIDRERPDWVHPSVERGDRMEATIIHSYTRAQALEDGELVDASELAAEAGFKVPVALTRAAWADTVELPRGYAGPQDEKGRLWDVLFLLAEVLRRRKRAAAEDMSEVPFAVRVYSPSERRSGRVDLKAVSGPGDSGEHVITIMLPGED